MRGKTTKALHTGYEPNKIDGAVIPPVHLTTTFIFGNDKHYDYSRSGNPTREILEAIIAALDGHKYGLAYSSGSAALANVIALLTPGEEVLFSSDAYGGTYRYIVNVVGKQGVPYNIVDFTDLKKTEEAFKSKKIKLVWLETPSNPLLKVTDMEKLAKIAHKYGAMFCVDNTFATPILQSPAKHGANLVVYSTTKYINGHSDSIGGAVTTSDKKIYEKLKFLQNAIGAILSPFDSWLTLRGLRTLELRMERHTKNAEAIVKLLQKRPEIKEVFYPGTASKEQGSIVKKQMSHPGAMISFEIKSGYNVQKFIKSLKLIPLAESLGGIESLLDHPASMTHASIPKAEREKIGLSDGLLRLSVGIENIEDLLVDLTFALDTMKKK